LEIQSDFFLIYVDKFKAENVALRLS
jgi:hypothetical protein